MTTDINEHSYIGPDHQLAAHVPARPRRKVARAVVWISLLLVFALALILVLYHHEEAKKEAALLRRAAPGIAITATTAQKGNIGIYLSCLWLTMPDPAPAFFYGAKRQPR